MYSGSTRLIPLALLILLMQACSEDRTTNQESQDHAWKAQTEALEKAEQVDQVLQDATANYRQAIEEQTQ